MDGSCLVSVFDFSKPICLTFTYTLAPENRQYAPEIAPLELRHVGASLNASGEWRWSFVTVFASPIALADPKVGPRIWFWYLVSL